ncbi:MAG: putative metal-binding motif-containing protein [Sandaracinus sp.]|nr:putative metal-binding motif-containing protein [Sandaracinus sp.]
MTITNRQRGGWLFVLACTSACITVFLSACGGNGEGGSDGGTGPFCTSTSACDDGVFCNGAERCVPGDPAADAFGCVAGAAPCLDGQTCDESDDRCITACDVTGDADGDGHDAPECGGQDCDDSDARRNPDATEVCDPDGVDEDCDPTTLGDRDADRDGVLDARCCNGDVCGEDCADTRADVRPGSPEVCDGFDNDCDGSVDEGVQVAGYRDVDGDQHGDPSEATMACAGTPRFSDVEDDCDDAAPSVHGAQVEVCDALDNDCDGVVDERTRPITWYRDADGDGFGRASGGIEIACAPPEGFSALPSDCDDGALGVNPAAEEQCNGRDDDCDGRANYRIGPNDFEDDDGDGYVDDACGGGDDCDDTEAVTHPGAPEVCDGLDNDCDGTVDEDPAEIDWYRDLDGDGYGAGEARRSCERPEGYVSRGGDCDDTSVARSPGIPDRCDGVDEDCDGTVDEDAFTVGTYVDADGDGAGGATPVFVCGGPASGSGIFPNDCDDTDPRRYPGAPDLCNGVDDDCDGTSDEGDDRTLCDVPFASGTCVASACVLTCDASHRDCDGDRPLVASRRPAPTPIACCGNACADSPGTAAASPVRALVCDAGFADCEGGVADGCETVTDPIPATAARAPRAMRRRCEHRERMRRGGCMVACAVGFEDCNGDPSDGCEVELASDPRHCGACDAACPGASDACVSSLCRSAAFPSDGTDGVFAPSSDVVLEAGVYHFTTITIPAGVTVTTDGDGVLELYASGDVVVDGTIDLSGGTGGRGVSGGSTCGVRTGGGATGTTVAGADVTLEEQPVCSPGGGGGRGAVGGAAYVQIGETGNCLETSGGRYGGGTGGTNTAGCHMSAAGGGGFAGGGGGNYCPNGTITAAGGAGGATGGNTGGAGAPTLGDAGVCLGGFGGEPGLGAYSGDDAYTTTVRYGTGGGGGSIGRDAVMDLAVATTFRPGSGGGGGGANYQSGGGGGGGGGALRLASATSIRVRGRLLANGGAGGEGTNFGGGGGRLGRHDLPRRAGDHDHR